MSRLAVAEAFAENYTPPDQRAVEMARLYAEEGLTYQQIGDRYGVTRQRVEQIIRPFGIPPHWGKANQRERLRLLQEAHGQILGGRETMKEAAERLGYASSDSLWHALTEAGLELPRREPAKHGGARKYASGCKCEVCMEGMRQRAKERRERGPNTHGHYSSYTNYGCRCPACTEAATVYRRDVRARRKAERQPVDA